MYTHSKQYISSGVAVSEAARALVMIHGRGGTAQNILNLAGEFNAKGMAVFAPQASNQSWYPYSFMAPDAQNQPALDSAIQVIHELVLDIAKAGISADRLYFAGFSQGACLVLEYIARNAQQYGGAVAFTGGLIGKELILSRYTGDFKNTPIFITTGNPDMHVPLTRVEESVQVLKELNANVNLKVYAGRPHTILEEEIYLANQFVFK